MGLDTSHDYWHGAYSAFMRWRKAVAAATGIVLEQMEGYSGDAPPARRWSAMNPDPIIVLLNHSDCDGEIAWQDCAPLADRLEELLPQVKKEDWMVGATQRFIDGLRLAAASEENVEFG